MRRLLSGPKNSVPRSLGVPAVILLFGTLLVTACFQEVEHYPAWSNGGRLGLMIFASLLLSTGVYCWQYPGLSSAAVHVDGRPVKGVSPALWSSLLRSWSLFLLFLAALSWELLVYRVDSFYTTPDTATYAALGQQPLTSPAFWSGERPFALPLLFKAFGIPPNLTKDPGYMLHARSLTQFQALLSVGSFLLLALSVGRSIRHRVIRAASIVIVIALGMNTLFSQWNKMLLSESLSISLLNILLAVGLMGVPILRDWKVASPFTRISFIAILTVASILFSFTRDTNAFSILAVAAFVVALLLMRQVRRHAAARALAVLAGTMIIVVGLQNRSMIAGERWLIPFTNVFFKRIFADPAALSFFEERGAPIAPAAAEISQIICREDCAKFHQFLGNTERGKALMEWFRQRGRTTYLQWLSSRPLRTVADPLGDLPMLVSPDSTEYRSREYPEPVWFAAVREITFPRSVALVVGWAIGILFLLGWQLHARPERAELVFSILVLVTVYPGMLVVWHGDAIEIERHATQVSYQLRLGLWMGTAMLADSLTWRLRRTPGVTPLDVG